MTKLEPMHATEEAVVSSHSPWKRGEGRGESAGLLRTVLIPKQLGRAPDADALAHTGIALYEQLADLSTVAENSPLLREVDAMVIEVVPTSQADMEAFDRIVHLAGGDIAVIAAVDGLTVANTRALLRAGAVDVLPIPFTAEELRQAVEPARRPIRPAARAAAPVRRQGKVVAFLGALGGVGTTSIATQTGVYWADTTRVGFLDLDVQFGSASLFLDLRPSMHVGNLMEDADRLDPELLQSVAMRHESGIEVVAAPSDMIPLEAVSVDFIDQLMRAAVQAYDVVLIDLPTVWTEWTVRVLQRADLICLVTNMTVPGIYQARRQLEVLEANGLTAKLQTVVNRVEVSLFGRKPDMKETEAVLGRRIDHSIANDYRTIASANDEGRSVKAIAGSSRLAKDLKALAGAFGEIISAEAAV
jgi:pilus assembly protein CpaE